MEMQWLPISLWTGMDPHGKSGELSTMLAFGFALDKSPCHAYTTCALADRALAAVCFITVLKKE